jgi:hypothetical protein
MVHAFPILSPLFPEAKNAMEEICEFVKRHIQQCLTFLTDRKINVYQYILKYMYKHITSVFTTLQV